MRLTKAAFFVNKKHSNINETIIIITIFVAQFRRSHTHT
jgi:hypothetical protein